MMRCFLLTCAAFAASTIALGAQAAPGESSEPPAIERMQRWAADHEALLDAKLAGLKAGLKLTSDQDKLWPPFEAAVRDAAKLHMDEMKSMMERMQKMRQMMQGMNKSQDMKEMAAPGEAASPVDRLEAMGRGMSERGAAITKVADAAKPLYASLDDAQKRLFVLLGREMLAMGHGHHGMDMMRRMGMMGGGAQEGAGMMDRKPNRMEMMGHGPEGEDNSDDE